jgi:UDP-N-acetylmuramate dehydrogenase
MTISKHVSLLPFNTFGIDVKTDYLIEYSSVEELSAILKSELVTSSRLLHVGSGSNLLFLNDFDGVVLHSQLKSIDLLTTDEQSVYVEVGAGVAWDDFVDFAVNKGWGGVENLSLIPGETGAAAVQNIGAYGVEVQSVIDRVKTVEVESGEIREFSNAECEYGYRESIFKTMLKGKYIVTSVVFRLECVPTFTLDYQHLEDEVRKNGDLSLANVRQTIIAIRQSKLPDPAVQGNAGSFFMNPVIPKSLFVQLQSQFPEMPHYYVSETDEKVPAAWLIDKCGWKGKQIGKAAVHDKQALVLVNKGGATGAEIVFLAEQIQLSVKEKFGIELRPEVNYIS